MGRQEERGKCRRKRYGERGTCGPPGSARGQLVGQRLGREKRLQIANCNLQFAIRSFPIFPRLSRKAGSGSDWPSRAKKGQKEERSKDPTDNWLPAPG